MDKERQDEIRTVVRKNYTEVAKRGSTDFCCNPSTCDAEAVVPIENLSKRMGYSEEQVLCVPAGANMGLGCGNPQAIAALQPGETVVDLGCGGGFDCFLAAQQVGQTGRVIGVDMTPDMISKARENARKGSYTNVEFRLGEIEHLPVADQTVDVIISNCVINLSPDKLDVYLEAFRILKPGGRLAISDVVATAPLPPELKDDLALVSGCIAGAATIDETEEMLLEAGFQDISILTQDESREFIKEWVPGRNIEEYIVSATIEAVKGKK